MPTNYLGSLVPAAKVKSLNSKTELLIIPGIYQKHRNQFKCWKIPQQSLLGSTTVPSWKLTLSIVRMNSQKFKPSQMF